jgi:predicted tellurium resistance membrane protein TerC
MFESIVELACSSQAWIALLTLTFMEIILGIDNIIFISIIANKLNHKDQIRARRVGLLIAMFMQVLLLFLLGLIMKYLQTPWFEVNILGLKAAPNGQSFILVAGGLFLLYKTIKEIHHKLEGSDKQDEAEGKKKTGFSEAIIQISLINLIFSIDSILTAIGLTQDLTINGFNAMPIMILGVVFSILTMMTFAAAISRFINKHPSVQMLALSFLLLIGFMLLAEGSHVAHTKIGDFDVHAIPKGYLYFAIAFSTLVQVLIINMQKDSDPVKLHGPIKEAEKIKESVKSEI